ncbi:DUF4406 domain-containing protein [Arcanobacterium hippocoleae]|uniref:DUF7768 domain-containing protein n=1 Tax=Arcanobacterium hippocoleae TaxID=149017 RepID=A0ABU1T1F4_9ACTO|nr:DUF4406 domain-containing protein [Arcanobacterium hippocoleae]MDR6938685.1 hypothetical protein [Arcanobacterium hippocoleae]
MSEKLSRRNTEGYLDLTAFDALACIDRPEHCPKALVYICSPYRGEIARNVRLAREFCATAVEAGYAPIAPHLLLTQFMDDENPFERRVAFGINHLILASCDEVWVYQPLISEGMAKEIDWAKTARKPIRYFTADFEEVTL